MAPLTRLTDQHLLKMVASFSPEIQDQTNRTFRLSLEIVKHFLGSKWADDHVEDNGQPGYVRMNWRDRTQTQIQSFRIVDLAELLFNLQHTGGFDDCIKKMRDGAIEATYAELDLGRMLYQSSIGFRFVVTSGQKGDDYDIEIILTDGTIVCADAKCKVESTDFSEKTVLNSLHHARTQFPGHRPSIIFVKVPPRWLTEQSDLKDLLTNVANTFLRRTGRVVSVKYYISDIHWQDGTVTHVQAFHEVNNHNYINRFDSSRNWDMFIETIPKGWSRLMYYPEGIPNEASASFVKEPT